MSWDASFKERPKCLMINTYRYVSISIYLPTYMTPYTRPSPPPLHTYISTQQRLFGPLDMKDTGFYVPREKLHRLVVYWTSAAAPGVLVPLPNTYTGTDFTKVGRCRSSSCWPLVPFYMLKGFHNASPSTPLTLFFSFSPIFLLLFFFPIFFLLHHLSITTTSQKPKLISGGGGLVSTVRDYMRFAQVSGRKEEGESSSMSRGTFIHVCLYYSFYLPTYLP